MVSGWLFQKSKHSILALLALCGPLQAAELNLCWVGANGYTMTGRMSLPDEAMFKTIVTEDDVTRFKISGYLNGTLIGTWDSRQRKSGDTWHLRFDPAGLVFPTGARFAATASQGWNTDGSGSNCGAQGFGFNTGDYGQDLCLNGVYVEQSTVAPDTPLIATFDPVTPDCRNTAPVSKEIAPIRSETNQND